MISLGLSVTAAIGRRRNELVALISQLYGDGQQGAMFIPQPTVLGQQVLFQDAAGTTPVTDAGQSVLLHVGSGPDALPASSVSDDQSYEIDGAVSYVDHRSGSLSVNLPDLGATATRVVISWRGAEYLEGQAISGETLLPQAEYELVIYRDSALSSAEKEAVEKLFNNAWLLSDSAWDDNGQWRDIAVWEDAA